MISLLAKNRLNSTRQEEIVPISVRIGLIPPASVR
jgi:hypothetical protein